MSDDDKLEAKMREAERLMALGYRTSSAFAKAGIDDQDFAEMDAWEEKVEEAERLIAAGVEREAAFERAGLSPEDCADHGENSVTTVRLHQGFDLVQGGLHVAAAARKVGVSSEELAEHISTRASFAEALARREPAPSPILTEAEDKLFPKALVLIHDGYTPDVAAKASGLPLERLLAVLEQRKALGLDDSPGRPAAS